MCGVVAIHAYGATRCQPSVDEVIAIRDHMAQRGPDGAGLWSDTEGIVVLGHRRLAVIGLGEQGAQPMSLAADCRRLTGDVVVSFNGEIYDHVIVRTDLERRGHRFRTKTDTEVLLHLYEEYGDELVHHMRGMFAFALWDGARRRLLLARDPYGIKPLYYADDGATVRVSSQARALVEAGNVSRATDPAAVAALFVLGSIPEPVTAWASVRSVPAGSTIVVDHLGLHAARAWCRPEDIMASASEHAGDDITGVMRASVTESVAAHLVADVRVGVFLSAGIDSGALLGLASALEGRLVAVTLGFDEYAGTPEDEVPLAAQIASRYGAEHVVARTSAAAARMALSTFFSDMDQPTVDGVNAWLVSRAAAEAGLKVVLSGTGGDELLGGYATFRNVPRLARLLRVASVVPGARWLVHSAGALASRRVSPKAKGMYEFGTSVPAVWGLRRAVFLPSEMPAILGDEGAAESLAALNLSGVLSVDHLQGTDGPIGVGIMETSRYLRNQLLRDTDWASMAHSLEVRLPLVDVQLLSDLRPHLSAIISDGVGKRTMGGIPSPALPQSVIGRGKTGFSTPVGKWITSWPETDGWRRVPILQRAGCPWARRWAYVVAERFGFVGASPR